MVTSGKTGPCEYGSHTDSAPQMFDHHLLYGRKDPLLVVELLVMLDGSGRVECEPN